jgi:EmrB/QacA subfamily drug resistance transporter
MTGRRSATRDGRKWPSVHPARPSFALILAVLTGAQLMIWIDNTILIVAVQVLSDPAAGLAATPEQLEWSISAYTLAFAALMLTGGSLADRFGCRSVLVVGMVIFAAASGWAARSPTATSLIAARAVMGVGSAMVVPATLAMIRRLFDGKQRAVAVTVWSGSGGLAIAAGPLLGGFLLERFRWGSVFLVNIPVILLVLLLVPFSIPKLGSVDRRPIDAWGLLLSAAALSALVYGVIEAGRTGDWMDLHALIPMVTGLVLMGIFVLVELRIRNASFDLHLFGNLPFAAAGVGIGLAFFGLTGSMFYSVLYLQGARGLTPWECGVALAPVAVGVLIGAPVGGAVARRLGIRGVASFALVVVAATLAGYALLDLDTHLWRYGGLLFVQGLAIGTAITPLTGVVVDVVSDARAAGGSALNAVLRQVGSVFGVAILGSLLTAGYRDRIAASAAPLPEAANEAVRESPTAGRIVADTLSLPKLRIAVDDAFLTSMHSVTLIAAAVCFAGAVAVFAGIPWSPKGADQPPEGPTDDHADTPVVPIHDGPRRS